MPEIQMPKLSDTMTEGTLVSWKKKKGDKVSTGDVLAEIETDKATMEWESPEDGTLTEIYVEEGGKVNGDKGHSSTMLPVRAVACQFQIKRLQFAYHPLDRKVFADEFLSGLPKAFTQEGVICQKR